MIGSRPTRVAPPPAQACPVCERPIHKMAIFYALMHPCPGKCNNSNDYNEQGMLEREGWAR